MRPATMPMMTDSRKQIAKISSLTPRERCNGPSTFPVIGPLARRPQPDHHVHTCDQAEAMPTFRTQSRTGQDRLVTLQHLLHPMKKRGRDRISSHSGLTWDVGPSPTLSWRDSATLPEIKGLGRSRGSSPGGPPRASCWRVRPDAPRGQERPPETPREAGTIYARARWPECRTAGRHVEAPGARRP